MNYDTALALRRECLRYRLGGSLEGIPYTRAWSGACTVYRPIAYAFKNVEPFEFMKAAVPNNWNAYVHRISVHMGHHRRHKPDISQICNWVGSILYGLSDAYSCEPARYVSTRLYFEISCPERNLSRDTLVAVVLGHLLYTHASEFLLKGTREYNGTYPVAIPPRVKEIFDGQDVRRSCE